MISSMQKSLISLCFDVCGVLRGDDDVGDAHRLVVFVLDRDLALGVGAQPRHLAGFADVGQFAAETMRKHDRRGHQFRRFIAGVTEHQTLVAGALLGGVLAFGGLRRPRPARCPGFAR